MIEQAYRAYEKQQKEAEEWYSSDHNFFQPKPVEASKPEKKRRPPVQVSSK